MTNDKINIILLGSNYYGQMASSQRVHNMFMPLIEDEKIVLHNMINYQDEELVTDKNVDFACPIHKSRIANWLEYVRLSIKMLTKWYNKDVQNVIYHYGYPSLDSYLVLRKARRMGYKVVFDIVENVHAYSNKNASLLHRMKNRTEQYFATRMGSLGDVSFGISDTLVDVCSQLVNNKIPVYLLPISVDVRKVELYKTLEKLNNEISVFYGGSFGQKGGIPYLIDGFTRAWQQDKRLHLYLTGKIAKESAGELEQLIEKSNAKDAISYLGCLPTDEFYARMANSDILCMLRVNSLFANSGFPFKLGEYLASGNAVIATRTTDVEKYLTDHENALLIEPEQPQLITNAILSLARDKGLRKKIGEAGQKVALECFNAPKVAEYMYEYICHIDYK